MEEWEPIRDWLIGWCGKNEREAEVTGWVELRALQKAARERQHGEWARARMIAHCVYLYAPIFSKGYRKETDPTKWWPLPGDDEIEKRREKPEIIKLSKGDIKELNRIKALIK